MTIFRCKMCGGDLEIIEGNSSCTCDFCGTEQTIPKVKDENLQNMFNRANTLRMKAEFDKAASIYEKIIQNNETEAEAYWGMILCKYGIEYVEDPKTMLRIPTCHRASYEAVVSDEDYKMAIQYADVIQKDLYESQAKQIDEIQKGILALAQKEEPYDVFICYKETGEDGKRTQDSVIANDIYYQLKQEGFKVFYAAITLEDKLGQDYEPCIFSALNSAKVMLSLGTRPEYYNAVWVKNEWSRFLKIMKKDRSKMLIPCYRDMDAYELPEEFAHLQAQDMSKIGFINDLVRGIKKVIKKEETPSVVTQQVVQQSNTGSNIMALLQRGNMALEDQEWEKADGFFEEVLNQDAQCTEAYLGKWLVSCNTSNLDALREYYLEKYASTETEVLEACEKDSERIADAVTKYQIEGYLSDDEIEKIYEYDGTYSSELSFRKEQKEKELAELSEEKLFGRVKQYATGELKSKFEQMLADITETLDERIRIAEQKDAESIASVKENYVSYLSQADEKAEELYQKAFQEREEDYQRRVNRMNAADSISEYEVCREQLLRLKDYKDAKELAEQCQREADRLREEQRKEQERVRKLQEDGLKKYEKRKRNIRIAIAGVLILMVGCIFMVKVVISSIKERRYHSAVSSMEAGEYEEAMEIFEDLGEYEDSTERMEECRAQVMYLSAVSLMEAGEYEEAMKIFEGLGDYKDSTERMAKCEYYIMFDAKEGDTVSFGNYNGSTEWIVLEKAGNQILLLSKYCIDYRSYQEEWMDITWEDCDLRTWLNSDYIDNAFSSEERDMIQSIRVRNPDNPVYGTEGGADTEDKVFLLSREEAGKYFLNDESRQATDIGGEGCWWWWLRSPGIESFSAAYVDSDGSVSDRRVDYSDGGVRPALWVNLDS